MDHAKHMKRKIRLTPVSTLHYVKLVYRSLLFIGFFVLYLLYRIRGGEDVVKAMERRPIMLVLIWVVYTVEMILRFFPSRLESPGCQKQFARNYVKTGKTHIEMHDNNATVLVALVWVVGVRNEYGVRARDFFRFNAGVTRDIFALGLPLSGESVLLQLGMLIVQLYLAKLTTTDLAAHAVANSILMLYNTTTGALLSLASTVCGQCYGAKKYDLVRRYGRNLIRVGG